MLRRRCPRCARVFAGSERYCSNDATELVDVVVEDARVGTTLAGRYRVQEPLGRGGMGVVYRAEQLPIERPVAVKVVRPGEDRATPARFLREARAMSLLQSPNTVRLYDFGEAEDGGLYLVMELLVGESLRDRLARGPVPPREVVAILGDVARSLAEAHGQGIVHRDLKPANVYVCEVPGQPRFAKVLDFGIASLPLGEDARLTRTSELPGTPAYVAPERVSGEGAGPPADVYALGVLAYEMLTGAPPFDGDVSWDVLMAHLSDEPAPLSERLPEGTSLPAGLEELVWRCLAKSPELRPADAGAFREGLAAVDLGRSEAPRARARVTTTTGRPPLRKGRRVAQVAALAAALCVGALGGWAARDVGKPSAAAVAPGGPRSSGSRCPPGRRRSRWRPSRRPRRPWRRRRRRLRRRRPRPRRRPRARPRSRPGDRARRRRGARRGVRRQRPRRPRSRRRGPIPRSSSASSAPPTRRSQNPTRKRARPPPGAPMTSTAGAPPSSPPVTARAMPTPTATAPAP
ncbi:MAG: serine/threonine protein kinase [Deltaproteobacteria bacterium]|nr:serine/threonine protein kinase [Deltaproteobacteria bacterium]